MTLFSSSTFKLEDPPLGPHANSLAAVEAGGWNANIISLEPVLADYIHALVSYYAASAPLALLLGGAADSRRRSGDVRRFSGIHVITSTAEEAALVSMSLATFGILFPEEYVCVSTDPTVWRSRIEGWRAGSSSGHKYTRGGGFFAAPEVSSGASSSSSSVYPSADAESFNPFVIAVTLENPNGLVFAAHDAFIAADSATTSERYGTLAVAASDSHRSTTEATKYLGTSSSFRDIVFVAISAEWWEYNDPKTVDIYNYIPPPQGI